jgi:CobW/HypB/UreG, nucleotide-binding domain
VHRTAVKVVLEGVLDANDALAQANRENFDQAGTYVINLMSSPGAGKTALLERTLERLRGQLRLGVLEGDVQTTLDADRLARFHVPLVQVNTDPGFGGECHLDANMVRSGLSKLPLQDIDILAALAEARKRGLLTVGIVGYDGGRIVGERLADHAVVVRSDYIPRIQEVQASVYHVLRGLVEELRL